MSNETTNPSTNQTYHVCEIVRQSKHYLKGSTLYGVVRLTGLSLIIFRLYFYRRVQEKRPLSRTTVYGICS